MVYHAWQKMALGDLKVVESLSNGTGHGKINTWTMITGLLDLTEAMERRTSRKRRLNVRARQGLQHVPGNSDLEHEDVVMHC